MPKIEISEGIKNLLDAHLKAHQVVNGDDEEGITIILSDPIDRIIYLAFSDGDKGAIYMDEFVTIETHIGDPCPLCKEKLVMVFDSKRVPVLHLGCDKCYATLVVASGEPCLTDY